MEGKAIVYHCGECNGIMDQFVSRENYDGYRCRDCGKEEFLDKSGNRTDKDITNLLRDLKDLD